MLTALDLAHHMRHPNPQGRYLALRALRLPLGHHLVTCSAQSLYLTHFMGAGRWLFVGEHWIQQNRIRRARKPLRIKITQSGTQLMLALGQARAPGGSMTLLTMHHRQM